VEVNTLVGPDKSAHEYTPQHADLRYIEHSDLTIANGLGMEGWLGPLLQNSKESVQVLNASKNVEGRYGAGGGIDPHAWMDVGNAIIYVTNIRDSLVAIDPLNAQEYKDNAENYLIQLRKLNHWVKLQLGRLPEKHRAFVVNHDAFAYFGAAYGLTALPMQGIQPDDKAEADSFPDIIKSIQKNRLSVLFSENVASSRAMEGLGKLVNAPVAGKLYTDALSTDEGATTYIEMMRTNVKRIGDALSAEAAKK
jgi:zinc/manganese transport system substrate-binding protein